MRTHPSLALCLLALGACDLGAAAPSDGRGFPSLSVTPGAGFPRPPRPDTDTGTDTDTDTGADTGADTDVDTDTGPDTGDTGTPPGTPVRFLALGDGGHGNSAQYKVAAAMEGICAVKGCDFAIYLGDNIYSDGVSSVDDSQFEEKFESPYASLDFPFYMALGNHDWGNGFEGTQFQVEYTAHSTKWTMPDQYYAHTQGDVSFFVVDSQAIRDGDGSPQEEWLTGAMASSTSTWNIAYGHHPYISNGDHGNTDGDFGDFFDRNLCGKVDVYFAGHDHDLQWLQPVCGTEFIVSGAAASLRDVDGSNPTFYETSTLGFMWVEIVENTMTGIFYDSDGTELYRRVVTR